MLPPLGPREGHRLRLRRWICATAALCCAYTRLGALVHVRTAVALDRWRRLLPCLRRRPKPTPTENTAGSRCLPLGNFWQIEFENESCSSHVAGHNFWRSWNV